MTHALRMIIHQPKVLQTWAAGSLAAFNIVAINMRDTQSHGLLISLMLSWLFDIKSNMSQ
ncbi:hypothetical protein OUZ56_028018 [Daphnia magna]|uniref:Uncharacterized protein n=1 Tax=Daphnia magna TaxID=35525 RepID=A0ABR0B2R3_9CRUS|nr:hypothetical protein OUZ56_028018 [Daphnia magna]